MGIITIVLLSFVVFDVDCVQPHVSVKDKLGKILKSAQWNYDHSFLKINKPISIEVISKYTIPAKTTIIKQQYKNCADIKKRGSKNLFPDGVYTIYPSKRIGAVKVYCDMTTEGGGLTVIQRRFDGSTEFFRNWTDYKYGFGDQRKEYWLGNDIIHVLTTNHKQELRIDLQKFSGAKAYAKYAQFAIGDENVKYRLSVSGYKGSAGDGLAYHNGMYFSARDRDNDRNGGYAISHVGGEAFTRFCDRQMDRNDEQIVSPEEGKCTYKCVLTRSLAGSTEMYNTMKRPVRWVAKRLNEAVSPQVAIQKCETHHGEDLDFRCNDCDEFICSSCIKSDHKDHEWDTVKKLAKERRSKVPERCTELRNDLTRQLQNLDQIRAENSKSKKAHLLRVTQMGDEYIEKIKSNTEHMKEKCIENEKSKAEAITKRSEALKKQIKYVNDTISHFEKHKNSMSDRNVIETEKEIDKYISEMTESRSSDFKYSCHIYEGEIAHGPCTHLLGDTIDFYRFSVSKTGEFNTESSECVSIVPKIAMT